MPLVTVIRACRSRHNVPNPASVLACPVSVRTGERRVEAQATEKRPHGKHGMLEDRVADTGPRLGGIAVASVLRVRHGSRSTTTFDEPGDRPHGQAGEALGKLHRRPGQPCCRGQAPPRNRPERPLAAMEAFG